MSIPSHVDDLSVIINAVTHTAGDYPVRHIRGLLNEYGGEVFDVVGRLEDDGWSPAEIASGVAR